MQVILSTSGFFCKQQLSAIDQQLSKIIFFKLLLYCWKLLFQHKLAVPNKKYEFYAKDYIDYRALLGQ